jgi:hypothetical protein
LKAVIVEVRGLFPRLQRSFGSQRLSKPGLAVGLFILSALAVMAIFFGSQNSRAATQNLPGEIQSTQASTDSPDFQFMGQGAITGGSDKIWIIGGLPVRIGEDTVFLGRLNVGDFVTLSGRILSDGVWLADRIETIQEGESFFTFSGPFEWVRGSVWRIGDHSVLINQQTEIERDLKVNGILLTTFSILENGTWLAKRIEAFDKFPIDPTATPIPTPTVTPTPKPTVVPAVNPSKDSGTITICHRPNGKAKKGRTLTLEAGAAQGHLKHGDSLGPCR